MSRKISIRERFYYSFDNTMSKGTPALIMWLGILSLAVICVAGLIIIGFGDGI